MRWSRGGGASRKSDALPPARTGVRKRSFRRPAAGGNHYLAADASRRWLAGWPGKRRRNFSGKHRLCAFFFSMAGALKIPPPLPPIPVEIPLGWWGWRPLRQGRCCAAAARARPHQPPHQPRHSQQQPAIARKVRRAPPHALIHALAIVAILFKGQEECAGHAAAAPPQPRQPQRH